MLVKKRVILYSISFIFIAFISISMIFILKGFYFDFASFSIKKGGSVFVKSIPRTAQIYIDGKFKRKKSPINLSLPSGSYTLKVEKDGFYTWEKIVKVDSGFVTWEQYVFLIKKDKQEKTIVDNVKSFSISKNANKVAYVDNNGSVYSIKTNGSDKKTLFDNKNTEDITSILSWSENSQSILIEQKSADNKKTYLIAKENELTTIPHLPGEISKIEFKNNSDESLIALSSNKIYSLNKDTVQTEDVGISDFSQSKSYVQYSKNEDKKSSIIKTGFDFKDKNSILDSESKLSKVFSGENNYTAFTKEDNSLWIFINNKQAEISDDVDSAIWSPESKKLLFAKNGEIKVYTEKEEDPRKPKIALLTRFSVPTDEIKWFYDEGHIIFRVKNIVTFIETDGSNSINLSENSAEINGFSTTKYGREFIYLRANDNKTNSLVFSKIGEENGLISY